MRVVETLAVRSKGKSTQVPARERIGEPPPSVNFEQLKSPRSLSPFLYLIQEQSPVRRNSQGFDCCIFAGPALARIDQKLILAVCAFTHVNARLLLIRQALAEEIAATGDLQRVVGFDGEEFSDAFADALASW